MQAKVIPVMDIINHQVVHAVRGERSQYKPITSILCGSSDPLDAAQALKIIGFRSLYVADLDAIMGKGDNLTNLKKIAEETGLELMVDAGTTDPEESKALLQHGAARVIVGTETLPSLGHLSTLLKFFGTSKIVASLDLKNDEVLSKSPSIASMGALELALKLEEIGVNELIVLDLARVGSREGINIAFLKKLTHKLKVKLDVGGGVRDLNDILNLEHTGVHGVLLATALHSGKIAVEDLRKAGFLN